jgi:SAM-dependent methyltransferase
MAIEHKEARQLERAESPSEAMLGDIVRGHLQFAAAHNAHLRPGSRILDFGCGIGASVQALLRLGYDAFGVDVLALWDADFDQYWNATERPSADLCARLTKIDPSNYRLPFEDSTFDFCFSDQVFEHVFNYEAVLAEIARVLKPGALSAHRFPGPNCPVEAHIGVPLIPLCRYEWYLALWAMTGRRSVRQSGFGWREALASNVEMMAQCNYPTKRTLMRHAQRAGVRISFMSDEGLRYTNVGRASAIVRRAQEFRLDGIASRLLSMVSQRYMVIYGS